MKFTWKEHSLSVFDFGAHEQMDFRRDSFNDFNLILFFELPINASFRTIYTNTNANNTVDNGQIFDSITPLERIPSFRIQHFTSLSELVLVLCWVPLFICFLVTSFHTVRSLSQFVPIVRHIKDNSLVISVTVKINFTKYVIRKKLT